ncbi:MAG: ubiquinone biosynthesis protein UbiA [Clostridiales bacterium GWF2_36_10]|nr:MAG: ubiquinone biosynthesis protein UbiA [Clostridiales bacterium GWF2_36_10]
MVKRFLSYVEIKTKITSIFPFLMTLAFLFYKDNTINFRNTFVFFCGMLLFDLTATTINNYNDTKKNHQKLQFKRNTALAITVFLFLLSTAFGIYLVYLTDFVVFLLGGLCFLFGVIYSYGPVPISHGPYGEIISGLFYGLLIPAILFYINTPIGELFNYTLNSGKISFELDFISAFQIILLSVVPFCLTANIMLANNICDVKNDILVNRYTLPYYLKRKALLLFAIIYYIAFFSVVLMVFLKILSPISLILLFAIIPVQKNINTFFKRQIKEETFIVSIKNFILIILMHTMLIFVSGFLR